MKINFQSGRVLKVRRDTNINMSLSGEQTYIEKILSENEKKPEILGFLQVVGFLIVELMCG